MECHCRGAEILHISKSYIGREVLVLELRYVHDWPGTKPEAFEAQKEVMPLVKTRGNGEDPELVAAVDTAYGYGGETLYAAAVVLTFPDLEEVERSYHIGKVEFPYIPGLFYYREGPVIVEVLKKLQTEPDVVMLDGHGIAHPRECGIACHIGVDFDTATVGCSRKLLTGKHMPVRDLKGNYQPIRLRNKEVGLAYRSKDGVKPLFISPGHMCDLEYAKDVVIRCLRGFRMPEPLRLAHLFANKFKRHEDKESRKDLEAESKQI